MSRILFLSLLLLCFSCGNDESSSEPDSPNNNNDDLLKFELQVDGQDFKFEAEELVWRFANTLIVKDGENEEVALSLLMESIPDDEIGRIALIGLVQNWKWQSPPTNGILTKTYDTYRDIPGPNTACQLIENENLCDGFPMQIIKKRLVNSSTGENETVIYHSATESGESAGTVTVLKNDTENQTVSLSFNDVILRRGNFDAEYEDLFPETITLSGSFEDIPYRL